jgi:hypothetical protein
MHNTKRLELEPHASSFDAEYRRRRRELWRRGELGIPGSRFALAWTSPGHWILGENPIWNVPDEDPDFHRDPTSDPRQERQYGRRLTARGLVIDADGCVYGVRTLTSCTGLGYALGGYVSVAGKKYRAVTSSRLFRRPDGSLCDVPVLIVRHDWCGGSNDHS